MSAPVRLCDVASGGAVFLRDALEWTARICDALVVIHAAGSVHGGVRPTTVVIGRDGVELLPADPDPELTYVAPEQTGRTSRSVDWRTDLYLVGLTLYELATGTPPFEADDAMGMIHGHIARTPTPPHERNPAIPSVVCRAVMRLLAKNAEDRYQSAAGLAADLRRCLVYVEAGEAVPEFESADAPARLEIPARLYGRDRERRLLHDAFDRASTARSSILTVYGSSGVGKSALVHDLRAAVAARGGFIAEGKFDQLRRDVPYSALCQALRAVVHHLLGCSDAELALWRSRLRSALGDNGQLIVDLVPELASVIGPQPRVEQLSPGDAQVRFRQVLEAFVRALAGPAHPLVLFLDDLQWIDASTIGVLEVLFAAPCAGLLVIGAYRENEIDAAHPLAAALDELARSGRVEPLRLEPLTRHSVTELIGDTLATSSERHAELAALVHDRTGGNPFFVAQFLGTLHQEGLLVRRGAQWSWDLDAIRAAAISENVLELMIHKLRRLDAATRTAMCRAACIGNVFAVRVLAAITGLSEEHARRALRPAIDAGFLVERGAEVSFVHDRVQQAAYALVPEDEREPLHLEIGRMLLLHGDLDGRVFDVVAHLNRARRLIVDEHERDELRALNLQAADRARASVAFASLLEFLRVAVELLPEDAFESIPEVADDVHLRFAEASYLSGRFDATDEHVALVLEHTQSTISTIRAHEILVVRAMADGEPVRAARTSLRLLARLGIHIDEDARERDVAFEYVKCRLTLARYSTRRIRQLPDMTDAEVQATMAFCMLSLPPLSYGAPAAFPLVLMKMLRLTLRHGHSLLSPVPILGFAIILARVGDFAAAKKYTDLAWELQHRYGSKKVKVYMSSGWLLFLRWYWEPFAEVARCTGAESYQDAADVGNLEFMAHEQMNALGLRFMAGADLTELDERCGQGIAAIERLRQWTTLDATRPIARAVKCLVEGGPMSTVDRLPADRNPMAGFMWATYAAYVDLLLGDGAHAVELTAAVDGLLPTLPVTYNHVQYRFVDAMALLRVHGRRRERAVRKRIASDLRVLRAWAEVSPANVRHRLLLVEAELDSVDGKRTAEARYAAAAEAALAVQAIQDAALARERLADHLRRAGRAEAATEQLCLALRHYRRWGARAKVDQLERSYPELAREPKDADDRAAGTLDLVSVRKAALALSGEIVLKTLLRQLMTVILENAGALAGRLILHREDDGWRVDVDDAPLEQSDDVPRSLVNWVIRAKETVVLEDAAAHHAFAHDHYFHARVVGSVLAMPILKQGNVIGVLYLENPVTRGAFTADRVEVLTILAGQAATAIENALLYERLERKVAERTAELERVQRIAVANAHHAGMAEIATGVLHNVGNVLNSVNTSVGTLRRIVSDSRVSSVRKASALLEANRGALGPFFSDDPRGRALPSYLDKLGATLEERTTAATDELERLRAQVRLVADVIAGQQSYAKGVVMTEEVELATMVEEVLAIHAASLARKRIRVVKRFQPIPPVAVQRTKLAHVLVNLVKNAQDAIEDAQEDDRIIEIAIDEHEGCPRLRVTDHGMGIERGDLARIFTHGFTTKKDGHGFGLHFCANSMTEMNGQAFAESDGPGHGATFTLLFRGATLAATG